MEDIQLAGIVKTPKTIAEQVYDLLKGRILRQEILPSERLLETTVCESLQVSRTPVREAFRLLQQDGLVERIPQGGVRVTDLSMEELHEVSALRTVLEVYAVELACDKIKDGDIEKLKEVVDRTIRLMNPAIPDNEVDVAELTRLNTIFHDIICDAAQSPYLTKVLEIVRLPILRFRPFSLKDREHRERAREEHQQIINMLEAKDKDGLKVLIAKHVNDVGRAVARTLATK